MKNAPNIPAILSSVHEEYRENIQKVEDLGSRVLTQNETVFNHLMEYVHHLKDLESAFPMASRMQDEIQKTSYKIAYAEIISEVNGLVATFRNFLKDQITYLDNLNNAAELLVSEAVEKMLAEGVKMHREKLQSIQESNNKYCQLMTQIEQEFETTNKKMKEIPFLSNEFDAIVKDVIDMRNSCCKSLGPGKTKKARLISKIKKAFNQ